MDDFQRSVQCLNEIDVAERSACGNYVRYEKILGRGAFKDVYRGFDLVHDVEVAWSQISVDEETTLNSPEKQYALYSEPVLLNSLSHMNIMKCYGFWLNHNSRSMNMITELFPCGSLRQLVKKMGNADVQTIKNWGGEILQGLHYLHTRTPCIIHRDIKCDNIFIDAASGEVKIGDFGLATTMEQGPLRAIAGTPQFMAPEYYDEEYNELVDVYAFGMCLMEMATCLHPYSECTNPAQIFKKVSTGIKPKALEKVECPEVKKMIEKCLLPASLRPSALELLNDPFFAREISTDKEHSISSGDYSTVSDMDESVLSGISALYGPISVGPASGDRYSLGDDSILSGISALYNSTSSGKQPGQGYSYSLGDVSMDSRITSASTLGDVTKDLFVLFGQSARC